MSCRQKQVRNGTDASLLQTRTFEATTCGRNTPFFPPFGDLVKATPDKVLEALKGFKGKVLKTSLKADKEEELRKVLEQA